MLKFIKSAEKARDYPPSQAEIVIVGRSNVGKSSFINALYGQKAAIVAKKAGRTRLLNFFTVDERYSLVDVPGYGYAQVKKGEILNFAMMLEEYFKERKALKLLIMLVDIRRQVSQDDQDMLEFARQAHLDILLIANKADKLSYSQRLKALETIGAALNIPIESIITFSSLRAGPAEALALRQKIEAKLFRS